MERKRVFVYRNEACAEGKVLITTPDTSLDVLKRLAGEKLGIKATRIFLPSGAEVKSDEELQNDDNLYFSSGEPFYRSSAGCNEVVEIAVLGAGGVGKSAVTLRFLRNFFVNRWEPTIQDVYTKTVRIDGELSVLELLDTAGQEDFVSMRSQWMMDKDGYLFVYSLLDKASVRQLYTFIDLLSQVCDGYEQAPPVVFVANKKDIVDRDPTLRKTSLEEIRYVIEAYEESSRALTRTSSALGRLSNLSMTSGSPNSSYLFGAPGTTGVVDDSLMAASPSKPLGLAQWMQSIHFESSALTGDNIEEAFHTLIREIRRRRKAKTETAKAGNQKKSILSWCSIL